MNNNFFLMSCIVTTRNNTNNMICRHTHPHKQHIPDRSFFGFLSQLPLSSVSALSISPVITIPIFLYAEICQQLEADQNCNNDDDTATTTTTTTMRTSFKYLGIDTSLNPSLDDDRKGSVAGAIEELVEIDTFGSAGTIAAAASITTALQSLPGIITVGYCGLMLPVCEDHRLAELASLSSSLSSPAMNCNTDGGTTTTTSTIPTTGPLRIADLLSISSVCGVGIDTVPLAGNVSKDRLTALILDVAGLAARWDKSLSCRVLPFAGKLPGDRTDFDSPYMINTNVFHL